jgi:hypothetical protein
MLITSYEDSGSVDNLGWTCEPNMNTTRNYRVMVYAK